MKKTISIVLIFTMIFSMSACGNAKNKLVGNWVFVQGEDDFLEESCVFRSDGSGSCDGFSINWYIDDDVLTISHIFGSDSFKFRINKDMLYLVEIDGDETAVYKKQ